MHIYFRKFRETSIKRKTQITNDLMGINMCLTPCECVCEHSHVYEEETF